jgi:transposase
MPRLSAAQRERAIGMAQIGASSSHIAQTFGCSKQTINKLRRGFNQTGQTCDRPRSGRPKVPTRREDQYLRVLHLRNRFITMTSSASTALGHRISRSTVMRRLRAAGIRAYRPFRGMSLTRQHRINRLRWARQYVAGNVVTGYECSSLTEAGSTCSMQMAE